MSQDATMRAHQQKLEELYSKNQLIPRVKAEFNKPIFIDHMKMYNVPEDFGLNLLVQIALHKRADLKTLIGLLRPFANHNAQAVADLLDVCINIGLVHFDSDRDQFIVRFEVPEEVQQELDRFQFPLPMVIEPLKVNHNMQSGYVTKHGSIILRNNHHNDDVCLDHINRLNKIPFKIDETVSRLVKNQWRNLDKPKEGESKEEFQKRVRAFQKYDRVAHDVLGLLTQEGNQFYLTHKYDKRGRTYCVGYHVSYQGAPWNKAVIALVNEEITTDEE
ncbi:RNA polymerase 1 [Xanthomonas phage RiverRider]|uniref:RNA polymerase 1 n=1 Tax=Xanthomonas phage RiverRider TaxID=2108116 RepID=A0A2P1JUS4_9CAUD|nr:RNA polymerase 1 [Xanthomonas phage RiverRider]AVO23106.1 RNA polymerase 1 [Xanthomonas phage RiverRider]